ncbi:hypothetical protein [Mycobacterium yunnanensis]|uniref:hypothetical protein n=1 Tax=Mycobacterium yunnanensis TaxID=368477 RepID=UPI0021F31436|nr:hypothetical protein [Mycobacterium yunnanensis]
MGSFRRLTFTGHIAGIGTGSGVRMVVGSWLRSPFGRFADVMVETADGRRTLLAPSDQVAEFVSATYEFDSIEIGSVDVDHRADGFSVTAPGLGVDARLGGPAQFDGLLRLVPGRLATAPAWLRIVDPVAARLIPGVRTAGSAGNGRREYYGCDAAGASPRSPARSAAWISTGSHRSTRPSGSASRLRRARPRWSRSPRRSTFRAAEQSL